MPGRRKTRGEQFIEFMQQQLGEQVEVPTVATDVMRTVKFPGLDGKRQQDEPDYSQFDIPAGGLGMEEPAALPQEVLPPAPQGFPEMAGGRPELIDEDEDLL